MKKRWPVLATTISLMALGPNAGAAVNQDMANSIAVVRQALQPLNLKQTPIFPESVTKYFELYDLYFEGIQHHFGTPHIGLTLQRADSEIIANALDILEGVPVLPVHDSIRCKVLDLGRVEQAMLSAYSSATGQTITVELKWAAVGVNGTPTIFFNTGDLL